MAKKTGKGLGIVAVVAGIAVGLGSGSLLGVALASPGKAVSAEASAGTSPANETEARAQRETAEALAKQRTKGLNPPEAYEAAAKRSGVNAAGETFGSAADAESSEEEPDLILAEAENGKIGYVKKVDADGPVPKSPEEAARWAKERPSARVIPVYESDGTNVIGEFVIGGGEVVEYRASVSALR